MWVTLGSITVTFEVSSRLGQRIAQLRESPIYITHVGSMPCAARTGNGKTERFRKGSVTQSGG